jgi:hypothetical protein
VQGTHAQINLFPEVPASSVSISQPMRSGAGRRGKRRRVWRPRTLHRRQHRPTQTMIPRDSM